MIAEGDVWAVVKAAAKQKAADLIVIGTRGRGGVGKFLLGTVAEELLQQAQCAVLTLGPHSSPASCEAKFTKIVYATDFGDASPVAAAYAIGLAQEHQAHLTLMHIIERPKTGELVRPHELESRALDLLRAMISTETEPRCEPRLVVREGAPADEILDVARRENADLILLGVRKVKGVLGVTHLAAAVTHQVIVQATCPVLTVTI